MNKKNRAKFAAATKMMKQAFKKAPQGRNRGGARHKGN